MVSVEVMSVVVDMFWENESDESAKERVVVVGGGRGWRWGWFNGVVSMVVLGISIRSRPVLYCM